MTEMPNAYIFVAEDTEIRGLSLQADGANLPRLTGSTVWRALASVPLTTADLGKHVVDTDLALLNLRTRGYHIARATAKILVFPQAHRPPS